MGSKWSSSSSSLVPPSRSTEDSAALTTVPHIPAEQRRFKRDIFLFVQRSMWGLKPPHQEIILGNPVGTSIRLVHIRAGATLHELVLAIGAAVGSRTVPYAMFIRRLIRTAPDRRLQFQLGHQELLWPSQLRSFDFVCATFGAFVPARLTLLQPTLKSKANPKRRTADGVPMIVFNVPRQMLTNQGNRIARNSGALVSIADRGVDSMTSVC